ncbi:MAG: hypothetical protein HY514_00465 [Candidatus Aenigmarchaeota archaeon]|nr:hypothetical protein [Candidatus Aenigmarchaeota archaeon]
MGKQKESSGWLGDLIESFREFTKERRIAEYERIGRFDLAAKLTLELYGLGAAMRVYESAFEVSPVNRNYTIDYPEIAHAAATLARQASRSEKLWRVMDLYERAIKIYSKAHSLGGFFESDKYAVKLAHEAAELAIKNGDRSSAIRFYENADVADIDSHAKMRNAAAQLAEKDIWNTAQAIHNYEAAHNFDRAAQLAEERGYVEKAIENYERAGNISRAAQLAIKNGYIERAVQLYEIAGMFDEADELIAKTPHINRQKKGYEEAILQYGLDISFKKDVAAVLAKRIGNMMEADRYYKEAMWTLDRFDDYSLRAAKLAERMEKYDVAISYYQKGGFHSSAIKLAERIGWSRERINDLHESEIRYHENKGNIDIAVALAEHNFGIQRAIQVFRNTHKYADGIEYVMKKLGIEAAIKFGEDVCLFEDAAKLAKKTSPGRAMLVYERGTQHYIGAGMFSWAVYLAKGSGDSELLKSVCEECIKRTRFAFEWDAIAAAEYAETIGDYERAKKFRAIAKTLPMTDD